MYLIHGWLQQGCPFGLKNMSKQKITNCAIYTRVSTDLQAEKEFSSCESQEEKIQAFVKSQNNWQVAKVYSDAGYTGANTKRPALTELLEDIKQNKIDIVLVYKIDRLTRSPKDFYELIEIFEQFQTGFISITERFDTSTPAGRLLRNIMLTSAQFERELVSERTRDKLIERAKKGFFHGGPTPYGYERKNKRLIVNEKEANIVKIIFDDYIEHASINKLFDSLREKRLKDRQGKEFSKPFLARILRNITYTGKLVYAGETYQGIHQPVVSEELFELAQKSHKKRIRKFRVYKHFLFGGLIRCKECGYHMSACFTNKHSQGKLKRYYYYRCTSTSKKGWKRCSTKEVSADRIENYLLENLERISIDKNYIENLVFKLNHSFKTPSVEGSEPSKVCSKFSAEAVASLLHSFISSLSQRRGVERNLLAKRFIKEIIYSKESVKIALFYAKNLKDFVLVGNNQRPVLLSQDRSNFSGRSEASSLPPQENKFADCSTGGRGWI